ncbi:DUF726-domain-containing protein [Daldinia decipiens]|uniref:DUF726-domain-containing protein n=1 Tax=Daldinia decipiens TaxID=326647 RepID=UPI0020C36563|nr:DUF726-domain-containing protein [Daldinia decipiens]KAI1656200.1 DUF726-domain-containing protein [Daldinia decipiens]
MPRNNNPTRGRPPKRTELDLSACINMEQKFQLQKLISAIVDDMSRQIRDNFENLSPGHVKPEEGINPPKAVCNTVPNPRSEKYRHLYGNIAVGQNSNSDSQKENARPNHQATTTARSLDPTWRLPKSPEEVRHLYQKTEHDVLVSSLFELKRDAQAHFCKWRVNLLKRTQDIVIKNGGTTGNVGGQLPQVSGNARRSGGPNTAAEAASLALVRLYPPIPTPLKDCPKEKRALILHSMLLILLGLDQYSLYSRILLVRLASSLNIPMWVLLQDEVRVSQALSKVILGIPIEEIAQRRAEEAKTSRRWKPGMANAALGGNPGVLAAPLVAAGLGTVFGGIGLDQSATASLLGPMNDNTVVVGTLFGLYGARQGSKTIDAHGKDTQDFGMIPLHGIHTPELIDPKDVPAENRRMRVTIGITGLLTNPDDFLTSWQFLGQQNESYAMRWELEALTKMGIALDTLAKSSAWSEAKKELDSMNVYDRLTKSIWPTALVKISKVIENPWCIGMVRAEKAGAVLADVLINRIYGERPVTLIGYSLGARIIYCCLMILAEKRAFGLVENVIIMGAPCPSEVRVWATMKSVVASRLVNVYSKRDYMLGFLYRSSSWQYGVAGLQRIEGVPNVENFEVTQIATNHLRYHHLVGSVLKKVGWEDINYDQIMKEQQKLNAHISAEAKLDEEREKKSRAKCKEDIRVVANGVKGVKLGSK